MICPTDNQPCGWRCQTPCNSDDTRLIISRPQPDGSEIVVHRGPTMAERRAAHEAGTCDALCAFCITEAEQYAERDLKG